MNFIEAMRKLHKGGEARRKDWFEDNYLIFRDQSIIQENGDNYDFSFLDYLANDWEEYEEKPELFSFSEALQALKEGKTIQRIDKRITKLKTDKNNGLFFVDGSVMNKSFSMEFLHILANDWIILEDEEL